MIIPIVAAITPVRNLSVTFTTRVAYNTSIANRIEISKNINMNTEISYKIKMTNNTDYVIAQNNVMFSFPKSPTVSGQTTNPFRVLAKGNKLNIKPGDSIVLEVSFSPDFYSEFKNTEVSKANLYITGYIDKF